MFTRFASASLPVAVIKRSESKTKQNQLKDEGLSLSSWFQITVPSGGEGQESRKLKQLATSHRQPEAESSGHSHLLLSLLSPLYEVQDPMLGTVSPTVKMGLLTSMNLCLLTTKTTPPPTHRRPFCKVILHSAKLTSLLIITCIQTESKIATKLWVKIVGIQIHMEIFFQNFYVFENFLTERLRKKLGRGLIARLLHGAPGGFLVLCLCRRRR